MPYVRQALIEGTTKLDEELFRHIEDGLVAALGEYTETVIDSSGLVNGTYSGSNLTTGSTTRLRTELIDAPNGAKISYDLTADGLESYIGYRPMDGSANFLTSTAGTGWTTGYDGYVLGPGTSFIVVMRKADGSAVSPSDFTSVITITLPDEDKGEPFEHFLEEIETTKTSVKECLTEPCLTFLMCSDIHYLNSGLYPTSIDASTNNMKALAEEIKFDFVACLGDVTEGTASQEYSALYNDHILQQFSKVGVPYYPCVGNHDDNRYGDAAFTHAQLYRNFIRNTKDVVFDNETTMFGTNFYKDFDSLGLRCIFLNANTDGAYGYSDDTCTWFESVVSACEHRFLVFTHISPVPAHNYNQAYGTDSGSTRILAACTGSDKFIMLFSGHNHYDASFTDPILSFTMNCQKFENENGDSTLWAEGSVKPTRTLGDATEDCFDIVVVRPISKKINRIRFGAGDDQEYTYE